MSEQKNLIRICSVDIGKKNFCIYIEECDLNLLNSIQNIPYLQRYNQNGTPTKKMQDILNKISNNGKTILHINKDLTYNTDKSKYLDPEIFFNMIDFLDSIGNELDKCSHFVIEQQMSFGKNKRNTMAAKLGQHCYSYFAFRYGRFKEITEFPAYHKTCVLGAEKTRGKKFKNGNYQWKTLGPKERKKWAVEKALEILGKRGEKETLTNLKTKAKKDDLSDTLLQCISYKYLNFVNKSLIEK